MKSPCPSSRYFRMAFIYRTQQEHMHTHMHTHTHTHTPQLISYLEMFPEVVLGVHYLE